MRTRPIRVTIEVATLPRIINAASGPPVRDCGTRLPSSSAIVTNEIATPEHTQHGNEPQAGAQGVRHAEALHDLLKCPQPSPLNPAP